MGILDDMYTDVLTDADLSAPAVLSGTGIDDVSLTHATIADCVREYADASGIGFVKGTKTLTVLASELGSVTPQRGYRITMGGTVHEVLNPRPYHTAAGVIHAWALDCVEIR